MLLQEVLTVKIEALASQLHTAELADDNGEYNADVVDRLNVLVKALAKISK